ncbi:MAG: late competence development ComFB family protein [Deferrisomatales bacterium]|nr:late competence development ComFB family protein [Deferrisomatales bacterium]
MIERIVAEAFRAQILTREMQGKLQRLIAGAPEISKAEYETLARLRGAILDGVVQVVGTRRFRNVMEELVWEELEARGMDRESLGERAHDVIAYALNRLPPLYATSEVGAEFQRTRARGELRAMLADGVSEAVEQARQQPNWHPERDPVRGDLVSEVGALLRQHASAYEIPGGG